MTIVDDFIGAAQDTVAWPFQAAGDLVGGAGEAAGDFTGGLFGGLFGGLGNWLFQLAALGLAALVVVMVVS
jgi:hypothetical protein